MWGTTGGVSRGENSDSSSKMSQRQWRGHKCGGIGELF